MKDRSNLNEDNSIAVFCSTTLLNIYGYLLRNLVAKKYSSIKLAEFEVTIGTLVKGLDIKVGFTYATMAIHEVMINEEGSTTSE